MNAWDRLDVLIAGPVPDVTLEELRLMTDDQAKTPAPDNVPTPPTEPTEPALESEDDPSVEHEPVTEE